MTTPSAPSKVTSQHFLDAQAPLLFKEGTTLAFVLILAFYGSLLLHKIDLPAADDLPRHIQNGATLLHGNTDILHKNVYAYTEGEYPFTNHHWLSGVIFYVLQRLVGFDGLVVFKAELGAVSPRVAQVQGVWVHPERRGTGLGTAAMAAVVADALRTVAPVVSLYVNDFNAAARAVYRRCGFTQVGMFSTVLF